jgi:metalloendopeptidase OMA1, mitochondrial
MVVDDPKTVNAMASFGNVVVFTGILPVARDEEGLAAVLAHGELFASVHFSFHGSSFPFFHPSLFASLIYDGWWLIDSQWMNPEIGHVTARHNSEKVSSAQVGLVISTLLVAVLGIDFGLSRFLQTYLLELPGDRRVELEADAIGLRLMSKACYKPEAAAEYVSSSFFPVLYLFKGWLTFQ